MRRSLVFLALAAMVAFSAFAEYVVVLKDGRRYVAKEKWKVADGKAIIELTDGRRLQLDPALIDAAASEAATRSGLGDAKVLQTAPQSPPKSSQSTSSLGSLATIRKPSRPTKAPGTDAARPTRPVSAGPLDPSVASKFTAAFENVGLFDAELVKSAPDRLRIDLTADNEESVFKAISATSFIFANVPSDLAVVELFMRTITGGSAGRFQMTREEALALANKQMEWSDYYVRKVIF
ncbi:MAG TPA: hypothetical protein VMS56_04965 [Thermoanaerobaculia bacterium]|nr:hypothetical protein [Thermoanaerobaculia bacterium]